MARAIQFEIRNEQDLATFTEIVRGMWLRGKQPVFERVDTKRSGAQNSALHKYCQQLADALNDAGLDMRKALEHHAEIPWTGHSVKERIWRPVQEAQTGHDSTTRASTKDYPAIYETLSRHFASKHGITVHWPCRETQMMEAMSATP